MQKEIADLGKSLKKGSFKQIPNNKHITGHVSKNHSGEVKFHPLWNDDEIGKDSTGKSEKDAQKRCSDAAKKHASTGMKESTEFRDKVFQRLEEANKYQGWNTKPTDHKSYDEWHKDIQKNYGGAELTISKKDGNTVANHLRKGSVGTWSHDSGHGWMKPKK